MPPGVYGAKVLVTVLFSRTQPLIRYAMSDRVCVSTAACECGRPFRLLAGIQGRREDVLHLSDDRGGTVAIAPNVFHGVLEPAPVHAWQVVQEPEGLRVLLAGVPAGLDTHALADRLQQVLLGLGAGRQVVRMERVDAIPRAPLGKARLIRALRAPAPASE